MRTLAIAAVQTAPVPYDTEATWHRFAERVRSVRTLFPHVELVIVPELFLASVGPLPAETPDGWPAEAAEPVPGPLTDRLAKLARETGLWLVPGTVIERAEDGRIHNTALAISPEGEIAARYRKVFPWQPYEPAVPGDSFTVFDIPGKGRVGLAICYDGSFPETVRQRVVPRPGTGAGPGLTRGAWRKKSQARRLSFTSAAVYRAE
ncbi:carbon-nitrogen hydrolase family protein [Streptomyces sp. NPDC013171]|uniref:carbon-nitrogen hydrolase family protein n=1 Tax=Streptomyces sp. NPDC013171 TaxID=3364863 RepID=UPI00368325F7